MTTREGRPEGLGPRASQPAVGEDGARGGGRGAWLQTELTRAIGASQTQGDQQPWREEGQQAVLTRELTPTPQLARPTTLRAVAWGWGSTATGDPCTSVARPLHSVLHRNYGFSPPVHTETPHCEGIFQGGFQGIRGRSWSENMGPLSQWGLGEQVWLDNRSQPGGMATLPGPSLS